MTVTTWRRVHLGATAVLLAAWAIYIVRSIGGGFGAGTAWLPALHLGNLAVGLGRTHLDRKARQTV